MRTRGSCAFCLLILLNLMGTAARSETIYGGTAGNGGDSQETTWHFQSQNIDVLLTKPDGAPLSRTEVPSAYGQAYRILSGGEDWAAKLGLQAAGADLSGANWTNAGYPSMGQVAVDPASGRFKFAGAGWSAPQRLNPAALDSGPVKVAINDRGLALFSRTEQGVAWYKQAFLNAYDPLLGWQSALPVDAGGSSTTSSAYIALNNSGQGLCVYGEGGGNPRVLLNTYQSGVGWQGAVQVDQDLEASPVPQGVVLNDAGAGALFFRGSLNLWVRNFDPTNGWSAGRLLDTYGQTIDSMDAVINPSGQIVCVFAQSNGVDIHIFATIYDPLGDTWSLPATPVDIVPGSDDAYMPRVDINAGGMIACTFAKDIGTIRRQYANVYEPGIGWRGPVIVDAITNTALSQVSASLYYSPDILLETSGHAVCVFPQVNSPPASVLYARDYRPGLGWQTPLSLASVSDTNTAFFNPILVQDGQGKLMCGYTFFNPGSSIFQSAYNLFLPSSGWGSSVPFGPASSALSSLAMNSQGWVAAGSQLITPITYLSYGSIYRVESPSSPVTVDYSYRSLTATAAPVTAKRIEVLGRELKPLQNRKTSITFDLDRDGWVSINIYSLRGDRVRTLVNQYYASGRYGVEWGGENDASQLVASGVYIIYIKTPGLEKKQKVVVVK